MRDSPLADVPARARLLDQHLFFTEAFDLDGVETQTFHQDLVRVFAEVGPCCAQLTVGFRQPKTTALGKQGADIRMFYPCPVSTV